MWIRSANRNPLPDDRISALSELKAFADDKVNVIQNINFISHRVENCAGKEENSRYQHFLPFPQCFQKAFYLGVSRKD